MLKGVRVEVTDDQGAKFGCVEPIQSVEDLIDILVKATASLAAEAVERGYR